MALDLVDIGSLAKSVTDFVGRFLPDKPQQERDAAALAMQQLVGAQANALAQLQIDQAEASSPDRINHWRGALGWSIVAAITWQYVARPIAVFGLVLAHQHDVVAQLPVMDVAQLYPLLFIMLGAVGSHVYQAVKS